MPYYVYIAHHDNRPEGDRWGRADPIVYVDFVRNRKDGKARLEKLCERHPDLLPKDGWSRITHRALATEDNSVIEAMKNEIRTKLSGISTLRTGERRRWARTKGSPAGCYNLDFYDVNQVVTRTIENSGLYRPGAS